MNILGIHIGHDSGAALVVDGRIVADVAEERYSRLKHYCGLPTQAVEFCLRSAGLTMDDIDVIAVPSSEGVSDLNFLLDLKKGRVEKCSGQMAVLETVRGILKKSARKAPLYIKKIPVPDRTEIVHVEHHLAHAASAYYTSGATGRELIVTMDGSGDGYSICLWRGENGRIEPLEKWPVTASLGWFYSNVTEALGWWHGDGEGKTMGLAPYGDPDKAAGLLDKFHPRFSGGALSVPHDFGRQFLWNETGAMQFHYDEACEIQKLVIKAGAENVAAEAQRVLERQVAEIVFPWLEREQTRNLCCAGGVFLNVKLNQRIWDSGKVTRHHIFPNAGDAGLAAGAALWAYFKQHPGAKIGTIDNMYWGPEYSPADIEDVLKLRNINYRRVDDPSAFAARELADNKIVAWFQGRMESGPRAMGNRSILMSANRPENKDIINARVKFREAFRPFCPSILQERKADYLVNPRDEFFMITSFTCPENRRDKVPAVVHVDGTLRPQTLSRASNDRFWTLINEFGARTGEYLVLNTSFNVMGEPIVNGPREAIRCFYDNGLDHLVLGDYVISKKV